MHEVLVNLLGGLSLPRKSVVRLTDRPDMTLDVYRGRKTTTQQTQKDIMLLAQGVANFHLISLESFRCMVHFQEKQLFNLNFSNLSQQGFRLYKIKLCFLSRNSLPVGVVSFWNEVVSRDKRQKTTNVSLPKFGRKTWQSSRQEWVLRIIQRCFFLFFNENIPCDPSLEPSRGDGSNEGS